MQEDWNATNVKHKDKYCSFDKGWGSSGMGSGGVRGEGGVWEGPARGLEIRG